MKSTLTLRVLEDRFDMTFENNKLDISTFDCLNNLADYILSKVG